MSLCNTITLEGGCGAGLCGSMPAGSIGDVELVGGVAVEPQIANFAPGGGIPISRLTPIAFDVTDDTGDLVIVFVTARMPDGTCETIWDGEAFTPRYAATSACTASTCGLRFTVRRAGGWTQTPVRIDVVAVDPDNNVTMSKTVFA